MKYFEFLIVQVEKSGYETTQRKKKTKTRSYATLYAFLIIMVIFLFAFGLYLCKQKQAMENRIMIEGIKTRALQIEVFDETDNEKVTSPQQYRNF